MAEHLIPVARLGLLNVGIQKVVGSIPTILQFYDFMIVVQVQTLVFLLEVHFGPSHAPSTELSIPSQIRNF